MKTLTVTVPAYNVENYLDQCLSSFICEEILNDIEVLVIDDGSRDQTPEIARKYVEMYPKVFKLISKENGGHGSAINYGMQLANAKYFKVVDGDDWVDKRNFIKMVNYLKNCNSDIVAGNYACVYVNGSPTNYEKIDNVIYQYEYNFEKLDLNKEIPMASINYKTSILKKNNIIIDEKVFYADVEYILMPIPFIETIQFLDLTVYMYRLGNPFQSVSLAGLVKNYKHRKKIIFTMIDYLEKHNISTIKYQYMFKKISKMVISQYYVYTLFSPYNLYGVNEAKIFNNQLKKKNISFYNYAARKSKAILFMRLTGFGLINFISFARIIKLKFKNTFLKISLKKT